MVPFAFPAHFSASIDEAGHLHIVHLRGELDVASAPQLAELLMNVPGSTIVVDLADLTFIDSSGIGALVRARRSFEATGNQVVFEGPLQSNVARVFEIAGLTGLIRT